MGGFKLHKQNRLSGKTQIDNLFSDGDAFNLPLIRVVYAHNIKSTGTKVMFSVPARVFRKATERNLLKRRMREAFRLNQSTLQMPVNLSVAYIYVAKKIQPYSEIEKNMIKSFKKIGDAIKK